MMNGKLQRFILAVLLVIVSTTAVSGQQANPTSRPVDVVIVLDDSESMATSNQCGLAPKPAASDPDDLRYSAARLLLQLADNEDNIAVIRFDADAEAVGDLGQLQPIEGPANRKKLIASVVAPSDYTGRCYTRMDLALAKAYQILQANADPDRGRYVLFLTDGQPTAPSGTTPQSQTAPGIVNQLHSLGAEILPVLLCNPGRGCNAEAESFMRTTMSASPVKAQTAAELLRIFGDLFAQIKPNLHVVDQPARAGEAWFHTRAAHAARQINVVTSAGNFSQLERDSSPVSTQQALTDDNIEVNVAESSALPEGGWIVEGGAESFVVVRTDTYPELVHPPAALGGVRYTPRGKASLVVGAILGPGGEEELRFEGVTPLAPLTSDAGLRFTIPSSADAFMLQVGNDTAPLQIQRDFRIESRPDLPQAQALDEPCAPQAICRLAVGLALGPDVEELAAQVYVLDVSEGDSPVYSAEMACTDRECMDAGFTPVDDHSYRILYTIQGVSQNLKYGDWAESSLVMEPTIYVRGLPDPLDPLRQPEGWPVTVIAGTTEDLGRLRATANIVRQADGAALDGVDVQFSADIRGAGEQQATLALTLPEDLRPGRYEGELTFSTDRTAAEVRLPAVHRIAFTLGTPKVEALETSVDFGGVTFDPSPNFRVDLTAPLRVRFTERVFPLQASLLPGSSCSGLEIDAGEPSASGDEHVVELRLWSQQPVQPALCSGQLRLSGPGEDYQVVNGDQINWRFEIPALEWKLLGAANKDGSIAPDLAFPDVGRATERQMLTMLVEYSGTPNFQMQAQPVDTVGSGVSLGSEALDVLARPPEKHSTLANTYLVPVELVAKTDLPQRGLRGTVYNGLIRFRILGLPEDAAQDISYRFRSPSWLQRNIFPKYHLLWPGIVCWPLTLAALVLLLFAVLRIRAGRIEAQVDAQYPESQTPPAPGEDNIDIQDPIDPGGDPPWGSSDGSGGGLPWDTAGASTRLSFGDNAPSPFGARSGGLSFFGSEGMGNAAPFGSRAATATSHSAVGWSTAASPSLPWE